MRSEGYCTWFVCLCVCVCVYLHLFLPYRDQAGSSAIPTALAQQGLEKLVAILLKRRRSRDMALKPVTLKATYLHGPLPIQAQWNIGSFMMERRECLNDNLASASPWRGCTVGSSYNAS